MKAMNVVANVQLKSLMCYAICHKFMQVATPPKTYDRG